MTKENNDHFKVLYNLRREQITYDGAAYDAHKEVSCHDVLHTGQ